VNIRLVGDFQRWCHGLGIVLALSAFVSLVFAQDAVAAPKASASANADVSPPLPVNLRERYPAHSIVSVEQADHALKDVAQERAAIEERFKYEEKACYRTFLANRCVEKAKEHRRNGLDGLNPVKIEADRYKRHNAVVKRDKALEDKRIKEAARIQPASDVHADKLKAKQAQAQAKDAADAPKHVENDNAFEKKQRDYQERQRKQAEKKANADLKRKKKADDAAAEAAKNQKLQSSASASASVK